MILDLVIKEVKESVLKAEDIFCVLAFANKITGFEDSVFSGEYCAGKISKRFLENLEKSRSDTSRKP